MPRKQKRDDLEVDPREVLRLIPRSLKRRRKADEETMKEMEMPSLKDLVKLLPREGGGGFCCNILGLSKDSRPGF